MFLRNKIKENKLFIIAEIGNNHEGSFETAKEMIAEAAGAGVDAVKFQTIEPAELVSVDNKERFEKLQSFKFTIEQFGELSEIAEKNGVLFFSTPFDVNSAKELNAIQPIYKIASGDNNYLLLIKEVARIGKDLIISTGLSDLNNLKQIEDIVLQEWKSLEIKPDLAFLHCVASYPVPANEANLSAISTLRAEFPHVITGYSDHTLGIDACLYAAALGAKVIEKHFTLDKNYSDFRDHQLSADPEEMKLLVEKARALPDMLGTGEIGMEPCEKDIATGLRRGAVARKLLKKGEVLSPEHLKWVRPESGIPASSCMNITGKKLKKDVAVDQPVSLDDLE